MYDRTLSDKDKEFIKKINIDKAKKLSIIAIVVICISIATYLPALYFGVFDFGIIFEVGGLIFLIVSRKYMLKKDEKEARTFAICSILSVGWILIYDLINLILSSEDFIDLAFVAYDYKYGEYLLLVFVGLLGKIIWDLSRANNPVEYQGNTDWFYEKYEEEGENNKNV